MAMTLDRATLKSFLEGLEYPVSHDDLMHQAQTRNVPNDLLEAIRELPMGDFRSQDEITEMLRDQGYSFG